jgi:hypothetical protein
MNAIENKAEHTETRYSPDKFHSNHSTNLEIGTLKSIKTKLSNNNAMVAKADKGSSIIILTIQDYDNKINNFITQNHFLTINMDPTNSFQNTTRKIMNSSKILIPQEHKRKNLELNPSPPTIKEMCIA